MQKKLMFLIHNDFFRVFKRRKGSVSIVAMLVLTLLTISCASLQERLSDYAEGEWVEVESENLLRKTEGATIIAEEKIVEATQKLYDQSSYRDDFKTKIESYTYRKEYVSEIENISDVNLDDVKIDVYNDNIAEEGSGKYKFWIHITAFDKKYDMQRKIYLCVSLENLLKDRPIKDESIENGNNGDLENPENPQDKPEVEKPEEEIPQKVDARDALIFRVERE